MKNLFSLLLVLFLTACTAPQIEMPTPDESTMDHEAEHAEHADSDMLMVEHVRANMALPTETGSIWMMIHNGTDADETLLGAEIDGCGVVEIHEMTMDGDVMIMGEVEGGVIPIPAGEMAELKQGGLHIMCMGKDAPLELGSMLEFTLEFANAGTMTVTGEVVEPGIMDMDHDADDHHAGDSEGEHEEGNGD